MVIDGGRIGGLTDDAAGDGGAVRNGNGGGEVVSADRAGSTLVDFSPAVRRGGCNGTGNPKPYRILRSGRLVFFLRNKTSPYLRLFTRRGVGLLWWHLTHLISPSTGPESNSGPPRGILAKTTLPTSYYQQLHPLEWVDSSAFYALGLSHGTRRSLGRPTLYLGSICGLRAFRGPKI